MKTLKKNRGRGGSQLPEYVHYYKLSIVDRLNKNAFQWDAYRPLVDHISACSMLGGGCLPRGVSAQRACLPKGMYPSMQWGRPPAVDRQTSVKT